MNQTVIARSAGQPRGRSVFAALALSHKHLDGTPLQFEVLGP